MKVELNKKGISHIIKEYFMENHVCLGDEVTVEVKFHATKGVVAYVDVQG